MSLTATARGSHRRSRGRRADQQCRHDAAFGQFRRHGDGRYRRDAGGQSQRAGPADPSDRASDARAPLRSCPVHRVVDRACPFANIALYSATKAAIAGFAASLRADLSPYGIRVTEIVAGRVETQLYKDILDKKARAAMYAAKTAVQPEDVARMVVAVLGLPSWADVTRFDIMPTHPVTPSGSK